MRVNDAGCAVDCQLNSLNVEGTLTLTNKVEHEPRRPVADEMEQSRNRVCQRHHAKHAQQRAVRLKLWRANI